MYFGVLIFPVSLLVGLGVVLMNENLKQAAMQPPSITGILRDIPFGGKAVFMLLITALVKTSLTEEIFFRGFIGKRLINGLGFDRGNLIQAVIFGMLHVVLFFSQLQDSPMAIILIFLFSSLMGWLIGYANEKKSNGSIITGWICHGMGNLVLYIVIAYII